MVRSETLAVLTSLFFALACNGSFWSAIFAGKDLASPRNWWLAGAVACLLIGLQAFLLLLLAHRWIVKPMLAVFLFSAAVLMYFTTEYRVYFDPTMVRNVVETDAKESAELIQWRMAPYVLLCGVLPIALLCWVRVRREPWRRALARRLAVLLVALLVAATGAWVAMGELVPLFREHKEIRYLATPTNFFYSLLRIATHEARSATREREAVGVDAARLPRAPGSRPRVVILALGETVRAANWGLSGYARQTTPELAARGAINFSDAESCGTSTEVSVPCMFSALGRHDYDEERIRNSDSVLHVLARSGIDVEWRDNQSGCKGVCVGLPYESFADRSTEGLCADGRCFDEILLDGLAQRIAASPGDVAIVLHLLGNHGPAYYQRYPPAFRRFTPTCDTTDVGDCSREALVNTYDNAILYTDHVLGLTIDLLAGVTTHDAALIYVSDHGESLGERNLYLHGLPRAIAPSEQTHVPLVAWFAPGMPKALGLDLDCLGRRAAEPASHDNLFHTTLGLFGVGTVAYDPSYDLTAGCRPN